MPTSIMPMPEPEPEPTPTSQPTSVMEMLIGNCGAGLLGVLPMGLLGLGFMKRRWGTVGRRL